MTFEAWLIFATFWMVFVTTPGPNAANCIQTAMSSGFRLSLWCVAAILVQASAFLTLSAAGVSALLVAMPGVYTVLKYGGAALLVWLGVRAWMRAGEPPALPPAAGSIFRRALMIATFNAKSLAGYIAAFSQFIDPTVPVWQQMPLIAPTALTLTALSYTGYCAIGAGLGRAAMGRVFAKGVRRILAGCFILYGVLLGASTNQVGAR